MSTFKITVGTVSIAVTAMLVFSALPALALSTATTTTTKAEAALAAALSKIITKADSDVAARITALNDLNTRVQALKNVSNDEKTSIASAVQTNITGLTALQSTIDADTTAATARADAATIFTSFRIYALVLPQGWILASADRVTTITGLMTSLAANIQTRITADQSAGKNVTALTAAFADMQAKITDANTQSASAQSGVSALAPDQGDKTKAASNHAALVAARGNIKIATTDIVAARKDVTTLLQGLKVLDGSASASASTSASTQ